MTMTLVSTVTVGAGGAASIVFSSIPQTGTDLLVVLSGRTQSANTGHFLYYQLNGDTTGSNYQALFLRGNGSTATSSGPIAQYYAGMVVGGSAAANTFGNTSIYIPNYTSSNAKSVSHDSVNEDNATASWQFLGASKWSGTAAITSITLDPQPYEFVAGSTASLYTITKGSGGASVS